MREAGFFVRGARRLVLRSHPARLPAHRDCGCVAGPMTAQACRARQVRPEWLAMLPRLASHLPLVLPE